MKIKKVWINLAESIQKKVTCLLKMVIRVFLQLESILSIESEVNIQRNDNDLAAIRVKHLKLLFRHQKCYDEMINSLAPEGEISSEEADLRYQHVSQFYEKFTSNQTEIIKFIKDDDLDDQINIFKEVQRKVLLLQKTLAKLFLPKKLIDLPKCEVKEHPADRLNETTDVLDSLRKKQKSLIKQIELIESKSNLGPDVDTETLLSHLSQLYEFFIQNQAEIETYVSDCVLDEELNLSREIFEKVISLQTKLKKIIAPMLPSSQSNPVESSSKQINPIKTPCAQLKSDQLSKHGSIADTNSLKQKSKLQKISTPNAASSSAQSIPVVKPSLEQSNLIAKTPVHTVSRKPSQSLKSSYFSSLLGKQKSEVKKTIEPVLPSAQSELINRERERFNPFSVRCNSIKTPLPFSRIPKSKSSNTADLYSHENMYQLYQPSLKV